MYRMYIHTYVFNKIRLFQYYKQTFQFYVFVILIDVLITY